MSLLGMLFLLPTLSGAPAAPPVAVPLEIELKQGSPDEARTRDQLLRLLQEHDLGRWIFTRKVMIDGSPRVIPAKAQRGSRVRGAGS